MLELYASWRAMCSMSLLLSSRSIKTVILFLLFWKWAWLDGFCSGAMVLVFYSK